MAIANASAQDYATFQSTYGYTPTVNDSAYLALAFAFMGALPFCDGVEQSDAITQAQFFIAQSISTGAFNPAAVVDTRILVEDSIGRNAITEKWDVVNEDLISADPLTILKTMPIAYALLSGSMCPVADVSSTCVPTIYVV